MTNEQKEKIISYVQAIEAEWKTGQATEHTYRPMLKRLVEDLLPRVLVINEPKHIECGAPDYLCCLPIEWRSNSCGCVVREW